MKNRLILGLAALAGALLLAGCAGGNQPQPAAPVVETAAAPTTAETAALRPTYELITLLPRDAIPAIFAPQFVAGVEADDQYSPKELVLGVEIDGQARAYSIPFLSGHEIVNDMVAGHPIAVTW